MIGGERILVVKLADIGDAVLALPAIQALRDAYPDSQIDVVTTEPGANVFRLSPAVNEIITLAKRRFDRVRGLISPGGVMDLASFALRLRRSRYTSVLLLHHLTTNFGASKFRALARATGAPVVAGLDNGRGRFLTHRAIDYGFGERSEWEYGLKVAELLGADTSPQRPHIEIPEQALSTAEEMRARYGIKAPYAVIHAEVGDYSPARAWPVDRYADVARELIETHRLPVVLVGVEAGRREYRDMEAIPGLTSLVGKTSFAELCELVRSSSLVIGCDSAVAHLAAAFDRPLAAIFGPSNIDAWKPYGATEHIVGTPQPADARALALHLDLPCSPCVYTGFRLGRPHGCSTRTCLTCMSSESVTSQVSELARRSIAHRRA